MSKNNVKNNKILKCAYCKKKVDLKQLLAVDSLIKNMGSEEAEFIWDELPKISIDERKNEIYLHMSDLGYEVLNVCAKCYQKARNCCG